MDDFIRTSDILTQIVTGLIVAIILGAAVALWRKRSAIPTTLRLIAVCAKAIAQEIGRGMRTHVAATVGTFTLAAFALGFAVRGPVEDYLDQREEERRVTRSQAEQRDLENRWEVTCGDKCMEDCEYSIERCAREAVDIASAPARRTTLVDGPQADRHFSSCLRENGIAVGRCSGPTKPCIALRQKFENSVLYVGLQKYNGGWRPNSATSPKCSNGSTKQGLSNSGTRQGAPAPNRD